MSDFSFPLLSVVFLTFLVAGLVKGVTGMGLPTVAMGVLGALVSPLAAASLLIVPSLVTNIWQLLAGPSFGPLLRRLWPMMLAIAAGTVIGSAWIANIDPDLTAGLLGLALIIYSGYTLCARQITVAKRHEYWLSPLIGLMTGLITGATGVFVIPAVPYLQALGLSKDDLIQALGISFTVSTIALATGLGTHGAFQVEQLVLSTSALIPALIGMCVGQFVRQRISPIAFRRGFLVCLLLLGSEMAARPFM